MVIPQQDMNSSSGFKHPWLQIFSEATAILSLLSFLMQLCVLFRSQQAPCSGTGHYGTKCRHVSLYFRLPKKPLVVTAVASRGVRSLTRLKIIHQSSFVGQFDAAPFTEIILFFLISYFHLLPFFLLRKNIYSNNLV